jgi:hypothetical protein
VSEANAVRWDNKGNRVERVKVNVFKVGEVIHLFIEGPKLNKDYRFSAEEWAKVTASIEEMK